MPATHKPPEFEIVYIGSATAQFLANPKEPAVNKWQFVVPESDSSCEGEDDVSSPKHKKGTDLLPWMDLGQLAFVKNTRARSSANNLQIYH